MGANKRVLCEENQGTILPVNKKKRAEPLHKNDGATNDAAIVDNSTVPVKNIDVPVLYEGSKGSTISYQEKS